MPNRILGKNAADIMMTIHAVEILRSAKGIGGFCIVAGDNDFAGLASWLRGEGALVMGTGNRETRPLEFKRECDDYKDMEDLPLAVDPDMVAQRKKAVRMEGYRQ